MVAANNNSVDKTIIYIIEKDEIKILRRSAELIHTCQTIRIGDTLS